MIKKSVLVVDDETSYLSALKRGFKISPIWNELQLTCVESVDLAIKELNQVAFDIVLVDMNMPIRGGSELIDILLKRDKPPYIIIITGNSSVSEAIAYLKKGVYDYISKPIVFDELLIKMSNIFTLIDKELKITLLEKEVAILTPKKDFIASSKSMDDVHRLIKSSMECSFPVLLLGESGTGKEVIARYIHESSNRNNNSYIKLNSAEIVPTLLESEMFGYEKGAFTGANKTKKGKFEVASDGTLFLDEIGDMNIELQVKLLRVLQDGTFYRVGGTENINSDARIITATNKNLTSLITDGKFREDLYYRLNIISIEIPPLRERRDDIPLLINLFLNNFSKKYGKKVKIKKEAIQLLQSWSFPGNIRELENVIARAYALNDSGTITISDLPETITVIQNKIDNDGIIETYNIEKNLENLEKRLVSECLKKNKYNKSQAAEELGISRRHLYNKILKYQIV